MGPESSDFTEVFRIFTGCRDEEGLGGGGGVQEPNFCTAVDFLRCVCLCVCGLRALCLIKMWESCRRFQGGVKQHCGGVASLL